MSKYYKAEDVISFLNTHCPKDMWEYQIANLPTIEVSEDCISREWLLNGLNKMVDDWVINNAVQHGVYEAHDFVKTAPSVVPTTEQSSKVGEWHRVSADKYVQHAYHHFRCSECGEDTIGEPNYCPNCGAKMRLE